MLEQRIQQQFFESADLLSQTAEALSKPIADAVQALLGCITAGGKLMLCGIGPAAALAQHGAALMVGRFERERPGLAALAVGGETEVQALGAPGDVLLAISTASPAPALLAAVQAAQAKEMTVVALTGRDAAGLLERLSETDVHIAVPHERAARIHEAHTLVLHCLCDAVDLQLLGEQEPT
ncbi:MAG: SIS domain-containing protein [Burkholderiaceae bacterium]|nr:SIS domain-containing protein [Burkholderiaceae bacterium]